MERENIFVELGIIRNIIVDLVKKINKNRTKISYDKSWVYIGKSTVHIHFKGINISSFSFVNFMNTLKKELGFYNIYGKNIDKSIVVYLHGDLTETMKNLYSWTH